jgi:N-acetylneuraminic acid mutarotase
MMKAPRRRGRGTRLVHLAAGAAAAWLAACSAGEGPPGQVELGAELAGPPAQGDGTWTRVAATGPAPSERSTPAVAAIGRWVYVFGGARDDVVNGGVAIYDDLHRFHTVDGRWQLLEPAGPVPPARVFAASAAHRASRRMLVFGGATFGPFFSDFSAFGDLWAYDVDANAWIELHPANAGPQARSRPSAWMVDDKLYVFGGVTSFFQVLNDLWVYDVAANAWTELIPDGAAGSPPPRHEAAAGNPVRGGRLVLYGGESIDEFFQFTVLPDTWEYDLEAGAWTDVTPAPADDIAPPRNYGSAAIVDRGLYLHGGDTPGGPDCGAVFPQNPTDELWRFDLDERTWERQFPGGDPLVRLKRTNAARVDGAMYVFAGFDFACVDGAPQQIWNQDVYRFQP